MLHNLSELPADTLSQIRHIRVLNRDVQVALRTSVSRYPLVSVLKLLPGLRLDRLTVLDEYPDEASYKTLHRLIVESNGWKTSRYMCQGSEMLGFSSWFCRDNWAFPFEYWRKPQPTHWQMIIETRDGVASNPSVTIYRSKEELEPDRLGTVLDPRKRVKFVQKLWEGSNCEPGVFPQDPELMTGLEQWKKMLVIVKRGSGVDYEQKKDSPFAECNLDFRRDYPGMTWPQIYAQFLSADLRDDDAVGDFVDDYNDVDEYHTFRRFLELQKMNKRRGGLAQRH